MPQPGVDREPTFPHTSPSPAVSPADVESDEEAATSAASGDPSGPASDGTSTSRGGGDGGEREIGEVFLHLTSRYFKEFGTSGLPVCVYLRMAQTFCDMHVFLSLCSYWQW